jgi:hypothetical protein
MPIRTRDDSHRRRRTPKLIGAAIAVGLLAGAAPATTALANQNYSLDGTLNCGGALAQYMTYRAHATGTSSLRKTFDDWITGTETRYGLRNRDDVQVTPTIAFAVRQYTTKSFGNVAKGSYAVNARIGGIGSGRCSLGVPHWQGVLSL